MTVEKKLQDFILSSYRSIREFTQSIGMPYSTFATILNRGVDNSSVTNIIKICKALGISADELANGEIVPLSHPSRATKTESDLLIEFISFTTRLKNSKRITARGREISPEELNEIISVLEIGIEIGLRRVEDLRPRNKNSNKIE